MARTTQREKLFKWVGPLAKDQWVFYAKKGSGLIINNLDDARKVAKIGTCKDTATEQFLKKNGFKNIVSSIEDSENAKKLMAGDIDLWIVGDLQGIHQAKKASIDSSHLKVAHKIKDAELYIAFSKTTTDSEISKWQKALDALKSEGIYKKILSKYM
jgi:polar amino acid transport system substrate-binding protein